ncbi:MAG: YhjD/YihY/BrkB family envelope integrity protein, partial [Planctomycetaceae bacterium]
MTEPGEPRASEHPRLRERARRIQDRGRALAEEAQTRFERERRRRGWIRLVLHAWERDRDHGGGLLAGGLAYRLFLWQLPAAVFVVCLLGEVADAAARSPAEMLRRSRTSGVIVSTVAKGIEQAGSNRWWLLVLGLVLMLWASRGFKAAIDVSCTIAWRLPARRRIKPVQLVEVSGFLLATLAVQTMLSSWLQGGVLEGALVWILVTALTAVLAVVAFVLLPHEGSWLHVVPGAIGFALTMRLLNLGVWIYLWHKIEHASDLYGSLGLSIAILLYLYLVARLFVAAQ